MEAQNSSEIAKIQEQGLQKFNVTDATISEMREKFLPLAIQGIQDKQGYIAVHEARMSVKAVRIEVEKTRKELKEESLRWGRMVDGEAKRITELLLPIEKDLETKQKAIDDEKERLKAEREREAKERLSRRVQALVAEGVVATAIDLQALDCLTDESFAAEVARAKKLNEERKAKEAEEATAKKAEEERIAKVAAEQEAERARLAAIDKEQQERAAKLKADEEAHAARIKAEQDAAAAKIKAEEDRIAKEKADFEAQKQKEADEKRRAEELEVAKKKAADEALAAEKARVEREAEEKRQAEAELAAEEERIAALRPDAEKLIDFAAKIMSFAATLPDVKQAASRGILATAHQGLVAIAESIHIGVKEIQKPKKRRVA